MKPYVHEYAHLYLYQNIIQSQARCDNFSFSLKGLVNLFSYTICLGEKQNRYRKELTQLSPQIYIWLRLFSHHFTIIFEEKCYIKPLKADLISHERIC